MKLRSLVLTIALLIAVAILVLQRSQISKLTTDVESLRQQRDQAASNDTLITSISASNAATADQSAELLRLRAQVTALRTKTNEIARLQAENSRIRAALDSARKTMRGSDEDEPPPTEERRQAIARLTDSRIYVLALTMQAEENQQRMTTNLDQVAPYLAKLGQQPTGTNEFDIVFQGSTSSATSPSSIILLRERQPRQTQDGGWTKAYGFLDGHSEIHKESTPNFDAYEQQHIWPLPTP